MAPPLCPCGTNLTKLVGEQLRQPWGLEVVLALACPGLLAVLLALPLGPVAL